MLDKGASAALIKTKTSRRSLMYTLFSGAGRAILGAACAALLFSTSAAIADNGGQGNKGNQGNQSVAQRLGGADGIEAFINARVVPALVASDIGHFFLGDPKPLTESTAQTVRCLALLLDHDLGGRSPKNGAVVTDPAAAPFPVQHQCRSSMSNVHRGMNINDAEFALFINIVADQATQAGVAPADVAEVGKVLGRYRGSITNK
jgi:hypothetical protein